MLSMSSSKSIDIILALLFLWCTDNALLAHLNKLRVLKSRKHNFEEKIMKIISKFLSYEPHHEKTNILPTVTAKQISAFVFTR